MRTAPDLPRLRRSAGTAALVLCLSLPGLQRLSADAIDRAWQTAIEPVTLSLRNKLANAPYTVTFIVEAVGRDAQWTHTTESAPNAWQRPQFPRDFKGPAVDHLQARAYTWRAQVLSEGAKRVAGGQFTYPNGSATAPPGRDARPPTPGRLIAEFDRLFAERYAITLQLHPEQVQGGPYLTCLAHIHITDTHNGKRGVLLSPHFSFPEALLRPYVEQVREPEYDERIRPGVHRVLLKTSDYCHPLPREGEQTLDFDRGFAFADLDHDGRLELFIARFMDGQRHRTAYSVYALEALTAGDCPQLEPIDDPALRALDSASTLHLDAGKLSNHHSGGAYESLTYSYQLLARRGSESASQFAWRQRYYLSALSGSTTANVPPGHYREVEHHYRYEQGVDGNWQGHAVTVDEKLHPID